MEQNPSAKTLRDTAYGYLSRRPHSRAELQRKLSRKDFTESDIEDLLNSLCREGYLNDEDVSRRWAENLVVNRCWGRQKIAWYLYQRGIARDIIDRVQHSIWQEHNEEGTARKALAKRFPHDRTSPPRGKVAAFLKSRGFSSDVIYTVMRDLQFDTEA